MKPQIPEDVEALSWRVSSFTGGNGGSCVEVAPIEGGILMRNSNNRNAGVLAFTTAELDAWVKGCKAGEFDDLR